MLLTREIDCALRICRALKNGAYKSTLTISKEEKLGLAFTRKTSVRLVNAGILVSREGMYGGLRLSRNCKLSHIIRSLIDIEIIPCTKCRSDCHIRLIMASADNVVMKFFNKLTIKDL